ncbi:MAG: hypothetical protein HC777_01080, partial [Hyphomonadaceae bacterium]|nr:hypothetical protein [Hyphomonadaceae bacterium]
GGFQTYGRGANPCPDDARTQEARLAQDGLMMAKALSARYRAPPVQPTDLPPPTGPRIDRPQATATQKPASSPPPQKIRPDWTKQTRD